MGGKLDTTGGGDAGTVLLFLLLHLKNHLDPQLQGAAVMLTWGRGVSIQGAEDWRGRPQRRKSRNREGAIQTSPPIKTEGPIIQGADVQLRTQPIPLNRLADHLGDKLNDALTPIDQVRMLWGVLGSNPLLPQGTNGSDT